MKKRQDDLAEKEWTDEKYIQEAKKEPDRLSFWRRYTKTELEASKEVCNNPPQFDNAFRKEFPDPVKYLKNKEVEIEQ